MGCQVSSANAIQVKPGAVYAVNSDHGDDFMKRIGSNDTYESRETSVNFKSRRGSKEMKGRSGDTHDAPAPLVRTESICIIPEAIQECEGEGLGDISQRPSDRCYSPTEQSIMRDRRTPKDEPELLNHSPILSCRIKPSASGELPLSSNFVRTRSPTDFMLSRSFDEMDENLISYYRRKPSAGAVIPKAINENQGFTEPTFILSKAFLPTPGQSQNNSEGSLVTASSVVLQTNNLEDESSKVEAQEIEDPAFSYVHVDKSVTLSCFAVQPDSWYTAPRPYLRVIIVPFVWW